MTGTKPKTIKNRPTAKKQKSSTEKIWGTAVYQHGYAGIPSILIKAQARLGLSTTQFNIIIQLLDYWFEPERKPYPTKKDIAGRIGLTEKTVQNNIRQLEDAGLVRREIRRKPQGDYSSNIYHLEGLVKKVQELEPDFAEIRELNKMKKKLAETPKGKRKL